VTTAAPRQEITSQVTIAPAAAAPGATLTVTVADLKGLSGVTVNKEARSSSAIPRC
jgi:hypothetical protein